MHKSNIYSHCGFVIFKEEQVAETGARMANGTTIHGGKIVARGPQEQRRKGYSGEYTGKIGHVPTTKNDKRKYTDCIRYLKDICTNGTDVSNLATHPSC